MRRRSLSIPQDETVQSLAPSQCTIAAFDRAFASWLERRGQSNRDWRTHRVRLIAPRPRVERDPAPVRPGSFGQDGRTREEWYRQYSIERIDDRNRRLRALAQDTPIFGAQDYARRFSTTADSARRILRDAASIGFLELARAGRSGRCPVQPLYRLSPDKDVALP
jgi:hypothetical protein